MQEPSKDFIGEFGVDQEKKKLPSGYYNRPITYFNPKTKQTKPAQWVTKTKPTDKVQIPEPDTEGHVSFPAESITENELKEMVSTAVLHMMNAPTPGPLISELTEHQRKEVENCIYAIRRRPGIMSITLKEDFDTDECSVRALIDPTNRKNWMQIKEETLYKLPYDFKESLHEFASSIWENSGDYFPNIHFRVLKDIQVWVYTNSPQPLNAYYGNSQISEAPSREFTLEPGMEILYTHGGSYVRTSPQARVAYQIGLFEPAGVFEKPQGQYKDLWYKNHVENGSLEALGKQIPPVKFELVFGKTV